MLLALQEVITPMDVLLGISLMPSKVLSTSGVSKITEDKIRAFEEFIIFLG